MNSIKRKCIKDLADICALLTYAGLRNPKINKQDFPLANKMVETIDAVEERDWNSISDALGLSAPVLKRTISLTLTD